LAQPVTATCLGRSPLTSPSRKESAVAEPNDLQRNYKEFLDLLPLTLALAGLPQSESGTYYTEEQIEARVFTIKHAYRAARTVARECIQR
jgi:hypothetical protein